MKTNTHWSAEQIGDMPLRRRTDRAPNSTDNPLAVLASLLVMLFAVIGVVDIADKIASAWK
jgi:hypothetical protein